MLFPYTLVKYDTERDEPVRGADGLCVEASTGEESSTEIMSVVVVVVELLVLQ